MNRIYWYLILAVIWILLGGNFTLSALLVGMGLSLLVLGLTEKTNPDPIRPSQLKDLLAISFSFMGSVIRANITLAWDILWHRKAFSHAFFKVDCSGLTPWQTVLLGNMISLTPGSLTLDADSQGRTLYVHTLYGDKVDAIHSQILALVQRMSKLRVQASQAIAKEDPL
jgi:multicomponent Na+:H+ antiporter subunit E